jgi:hypothetical protein
VRDEEGEDQRQRHHDGGRHHAREVIPRFLGPEVEDAERRRGARVALHGDERPEQIVPVRDDGEDREGRGSRPAFGRITPQTIRASPMPSSRAAWISSSGSALKNWRKRKIAKTEMVREDQCCEGVEHPAAEKAT